MLEATDCVLVVVDVQGRLAQLMHNRQLLFRNIGILIRGAQLLEIPILWCQQVPEALGATIPEIAELLSGNEPIDKSSFSCCGHGEFNRRLAVLERSEVILCGIEAHVCVYQTALDLVENGRGVSVITDAVSSRSAENRQTALERMAAMGVGIMSTEMLLFELMRTAEHPSFREIARLVK